MEHPENSEEYKGLTVNKGIEQPSIVNPYLKLRKKPRRREFSVGEYVEGIVKGDVTVLSQAVTLVESVKPEHQAIAQEVISPESVPAFLWRRLSRPSCSISRDARSFHSLLGSMAISAHSWRLRSTLARGSRLIPWNM